MKIIKKAVEQQERSLKTAGGSFMNQLASPELGIKHKEYNSAMRGTKLSSIFSVKLGSETLKDGGKQQ